MSRLSILTRLTAFLGLTMVAAYAVAADIEIPDYYDDVCQRFADSFPDEHLTRQSLDDRMSRRAWTNYLSALDYDRLYFLASDIESLADQKDKLDDALRDGNLDFAFNVYEIFKQRVRESVEMVDPILDAGFDTGVTEFYRWRRRDLPWPEDKDERAELWRRRLKNEYVQRVVSREMAAAEDDGGTNITTYTQTNLPPEEAMAPPDGNAAATNAVTDADAAEQTGEEAPTPRESIAKRYEQFLTRLEDNDAEWVLQTYLSAFAHAYDPHSAYMTRSASEDFAIEMKLSLVGIGALLRPEDGAAKIVRLIPGGPADRDTRENRLRPGDRIIGVGQGDEPIVDTLHWPLYKVVRLIRGEKGTRVVLKVIPASDPTGVTTKRVTLVRDKVKLEEQAAKSETRKIGMPSGEELTLGLIDVPAFYANMQASLKSRDDVRRCSADVKALIDELSDDGVDGLLLDLRSNGGGSLLEAIRMTGFFINAGPVVQVKEIRRLRILPDMDAGVAYTGPLVVLVNRLSASASEILAAALQDYGRAIVVGDSRTHGKGTVQTILPLGRDRNLGTIKVTVSSFYRVTGKPTQKIGVTPDVVVASALDSMDVGEDTLPNALEESVIRPALFYPTGDVDHWGPELVRRSAARRNEDRRYVAYEELLARARELNETKIVPLSIDERREMAEAEKALEQLQEVTGPENPDEENGKRPDLVLEEALHILGDLVALLRNAEEEEPRAVAQEDGKTRDVTDDLLRWMRSAP